MIGPLVINLIVAVVMFALSLDRGTTEGFYPATIPTVVQAGFGAIVALAGLASLRARYACVLISSAAVGLLGIPAFYALQQWPHGDDTGIGWLLIVGGGCVLSFPIAVVTAVIGRLHKGRAPQNRTSSGFPLVVSMYARELTPTAGLGRNPARTAEQDQANEAETRLRCSPFEGFRQGPTVEVQAVDARHRTERKHRWLYGLLLIPGLCLVSAIPISWNTTRSELYPGGLELRRVDSHTVIPLLRFHQEVDRDHEQILLVNGREMLRDSEYKRLFPSPAGRYVVAEHWLHNGPTRVYRTTDWHFLELQVEDSKEEFPDHYNAYPFSFLRWEDDSSFQVEVTGSDWDDAGHSYKRYRQVWRIVAETGTRTRIE